MKIMVNGEIRDMTPEEEAQFIADHQDLVDPDAGDEDYVQVLNDLGVRLE